MTERTAHILAEKERTSDVLSTDNANIDFQSLLLSDEVQRGLISSGFQKPSPIQLKAIPLGRCGLDLIVQAKSGTGKTCVFSVIALESIITSSSCTQVLILAPTREIALQIHNVIESIGCATKGLKCHTFIGGKAFGQDRQKLRKCHIAVGTPGRINQLLEYDVLKTESIRLFVLDEADKLLDEKFQSQVNCIYHKLPENKQMLALSATYPEYLAKQLTQYMRDPTFVRLNPKDLTLQGIKQYYKIVPGHDLPHKAFGVKVEQLLHLLSHVAFNQCLIFSNLQARAQSLCDILLESGWPATYISGSQEQSERMRAMEMLKSFQCRILISTDLTARGIDAENINLVINLDIPFDYKTYLHRIGRAGRFGTHGAAVSFASEGDDVSLLQTIKKLSGSDMRPLPDPVPNDLLKKVSITSECNQHSASVSSDVTENGEVEVMQLYSQPFKRSLVSSENQKVTSKEENGNCNGNCEKYADKQGVTYTKEETKQADVIVKGNHAEQNVDLNIKSKGELIRQQQQALRDNVELPNVVSENYMNRHVHHFSTEIWKSNLKVAKKKNNGNERVVLEAGTQTEDNALNGFLDGISLWNVPHSIFHGIRKNRRHLPQERHTWEKAKSDFDVWMLKDSECDEEKQLIPTNSKHIMSCKDKEDAVCQEITKEGQKNGKILQEADSESFEKWNATDLGKEFKEIQNALKTLLRYECVDDNSVKVIDFENSSLGISVPASKDILVMNIHQHGEHTTTESAITDRARFIDEGLELYSSRQTSRGFWVEDEPDANIVEDCAIVQNRVLHDDAEGAKTSSEVLKLSVGGGSSLDILKSSSELSFCHEKLLHVSVNGISQKMDEIVDSFLLNKIDRDKVEMGTAEKAKPVFKKTKVSPRSLASFLSTIKNEKSTSKIEQTNDKNSATQKLDPVWKSFQEYVLEKSTKSSTTSNLSTECRNESSETETDEDSSSSSGRSSEMQQEELHSDDNDMDYDDAGLNMEDDHNINCHLVLPNDSEGRSKDGAGSGVRRYADYSYTGLPYWREGGKLPSTEAVTGIPFGSGRYPYSDYSWYPSSQYYSNGWTAGNDYNLYDTYHQAVQGTFHYGSTVDGAMNSPSAGLNLVGACNNSGDSCGTKSKRKVRKTVKEKTSSDSGETVSKEIPKRRPRSKTKRNVQHEGFYEYSDVGIDPYYHQPWYSSIYGNHLGYRDLI